MSRSLSIAGRWAKGVSWRKEKKTRGRGRGAFSFSQPHRFVEVCGKSKTQKSSPSLHFSLSLSLSLSRTNTAQNAGNHGELKRRRREFYTSSFHPPAAVKVDGRRRKEKNSSRSPPPPLFSLFLTRRLALHLLARGLLARLHRPHHGRNHCQRLLVLRPPGRVRQLVRAVQIHDRHCLRRQEQRAERGLLRSLCRIRLRRLRRSYQARMHQGQVPLRDLQLQTHRRKLGRAADARGRDRGVDFWESAASRHPAAQAVEEKVKEEKTELSGVGPRPRGGRGGLLSSLSFFFSSLFLSFSLSDD